MDRYTKKRKSYYSIFFSRLLQKRLSVPTQQYYYEDYTNESVHDIAKTFRQRKKRITTTDKDKAEGSFNLKRSRNVITYTLFYSNIYEFGGNL